jgi:uncharacterized protein
MPARWRRGSLPELTPETAVADLLWAINSPSLIATKDVDSTLDPGSIDGGELRAFLKRQPRHKVGHYFECLIQFWLERIRGFELVAHRHQVMDGKLTLGELDFVFRDDNGRLNHWETAVKFYLCDRENVVKDSCFIGPNTADTLERKIERLAGHQLPLSEVAYPEVEIRRAFVKGRIYRHPFQAPEPINSELLNIRHLTGAWIRHADLGWLDEIDPAGDCDYRILEKPYWLSASPSAALDVNNLRVTLAGHFETGKQSIHVGISRNGAEIERLFVVADEWPNL